MRHLRPRTVVQRHGNAHDAAASRIAYVRQSCLRAEESTVQVNLHHASPGVWAQIFGRRVEVARGVVHESMQGAMGIPHFLHYCGYTLRIPHIQLVRSRGNALLRQAVYRLRKPLLLATGKRNPATERSQRLRNTEAYAGTATRYERHLPGEHIWPEDLGRERSGHCSGTGGQVGVTGTPAVDTIATSTAPAGSMCCAACPFSNGHPPRSSESFSVGSKLQFQLARDAERGTMVRSATAPQKRLTMLRRSVT